MHRTTIKPDRLSWIRHLSPRSFVGICLTVAIGCTRILLFADETALLAKQSRDNLHQTDGFATIGHEVGSNSSKRNTLRRQVPILRNNKSLLDAVATRVTLDQATTMSTKDDQKQMQDVSAITIAYVVSLVSCGTRVDESLDHITEGGAVLKHSVHRASVRGTLGGKYDYKFYAIHHPNASDCAMLLADLGYELMERDTPVRVEDIRGIDLRKDIQNEGCCGEKELIKLEAYTLTDHPIVVHLDLDTVVLKPMDAIFDMMLRAGTADNQNYPSNSSSSFPSVTFMWPDRPIPAKTNFVFTRDYNILISKESEFLNKFPPIQGGFLVLRPDMNVYRQLIEVILEGNFKQHFGWGGLMGYFYGHTTIQGLLPYFYDLLYPGQSVELNRCVYNSMSDNPLFTKGNVNGTCKTGQNACEDCRDRPVEDIVTAHFTVCSKPWLCFNYKGEGIQTRLCKQLVHEWYRVRSELEQSWGESGWGTGNWTRDQFFGYCHDVGAKGYQRINQSTVVLMER